MDDNNIKWQPCAGIADVSVMEDSYAGSIYVDVLFDTILPEYQKLVSFLEHPNGSRMFPDVLLCGLLLEVAMKNAEHDEPEFWSRWVDNF